MEPHRKGELTEAIVVAELKRREIPVSRPIGDNERYDLVAESSAGLWRLQVKTGRLADETVQFHGKSQHTNSQGHVYERYEDDVDFFVVYCEEVDGLYLIQEDAFRADMRLRVESPDKRDASINWARDYAFDRNWPPENGVTTPTRSYAPIVERLRAHDVPLFLPTEHTTRYDALAETENGGICRLQFERGWIVDGRIRFDDGSSSSETSAESIDYVLVYCADLEQLYVVPRDSYNTTITLRVAEPGQSDRRINWAHEYEFPENWPT